MVPLKLSSRTVLVTYWVNLLFYPPIVFTELFTYCLSISVGQMSSDNGLPHVSLKVSIEDTMTRFTSKPRFSGY